MTAPRAQANWSVLLSDLITSIGNYFWGAWLVMLLLSTLHGADHALPAFGYWNCFFAVWVLGVLIDSGTFSIMQRVKSLTPLYGKKSASPLEDLAKRIADLGKGAK